MPIPLIVAGILIAKGFTLLGEGEFTREGLEEYLRTIDAASTEGLPRQLQREMNITTRTFATVHTILALLQAAARGFAPNPDFDDEMTVSVESFEPHELQKIKAAENAIYEVSNKEDGVDCGDSILENADVLQKYLKKLANLPADFPLDSRLEDCHEAAIYMDDEDKSLLEELAQKLAPLAAHPATFQVEPCLSTCHEVVSRMYYGKARCLSATLPLIRSLLGGVDLDQVKDWANQAQAAGNVSDWIKGELKIDELDDEVKACYQSEKPDQDATKMALSRIVAMLERSLEFYNLIYERLETLEGAVGELPDKQKDAWDKLVPAMYGAIAWRILRREQLAAWEAWTVLRFV